MVRESTATEDRECGNLTVCAAVGVEYESAAPQIKAGSPVPVSDRVCEQDVKRHPTLL